jgi:hypothetical protein
MIACSRLFAATVLLACSTSSLAQSRSVSVPNVTNQAGAESVALGGQSFVNQGLLGADRLDANTRDFRGETLGSFSGMAIDHPGVRCRYRRQRGGAAAGRTLGVPLFLFEGEPFFGQDRLADLIWHLKNNGLVQRQ